MQNLLLSIVIYIWMVIWVVIYWLHSTCCCVTQGRRVMIQPDAIFNDLEQLLPPVSRSRSFLMLNISETVRHTYNFIASNCNKLASAIKTNTHNNNIFSRSTNWGTGDTRQRRRYMFFCPCLSVCLLARLLKNACMDLDEMLRVDRCRDMDELINFWSRSGSYSGCRNRIAFSDIV